MGLNQADHRAAGLSCLDAIRDADNPWVFRDLMDDGLAPWKVGVLLVGGHPDPTHGVDVTGEPLRRGIASLEAHAEYLAALPWHPVPSEFIPGMTAQGVPCSGSSTRCSSAATSSEPRPRRGRPAGPRRRTGTRR